ncbi:Putative protein [Zobellia galactanivorans]|uniref:Uncharacterized protein n=1 Tax=Zobellia galactanivorans (strain DSM 12802 / CCUG 47099 / CIP 106680 / NCIMB 13871 / Dsij) TaxID=63186 RepID=G0L8G6_ZOBGA|nr:Putative protein [Zobellia galactanivorans]
MKIYALIKNIAFSENLNTLSLVSKPLILYLLQKLNAVICDGFWSF